MVENLTAGGYSGGHRCEDEDSWFAEGNVITEEFARAAEACIAFAKDRPDALRLLTRKNVEILVNGGLPSLFKHGESSARRIRSFLSGDESNVLESEKAQTVDIMQYLLSYVYESLGTSNGIKHEEGKHVEASVRRLLTEFVNMTGGDQDSKFAESPPAQAPISYEQSLKPLEQNSQMKRGDWICPKCSFMNFARNSRCLECEEARPKRQLTGREWECPQCDFFNYGRNTSCLRCDCKRPEEVPPSISQNGSPTLDQILNRSNTDNSELDKRLAANDEKADRWFSKVSQLGEKADMNSASADEDFPEIMPMRKGVNRFVVSTRKTPLERRLANSQSEVSSRIQSDTLSDSSINQTLDRILGRTPAGPAAGQVETGAASRSTSDYRQSIAKADPGYVPFVPLPPDMFRKPQNSNDSVQDKEDPPSDKVDPPNVSLQSSSQYSVESKDSNDSSDATQRWSKKVPEDDKASESGGGIGDEDFPEIMPMRKGENRFVVSKKKDRSLTSPQYKRRLAMEQANQSDFVPFVPFPPGYFAKKDKQPEAASSANNAAAAEGSPVQGKFQEVPRKLDNDARASNWAPMGVDSPQQQGGIGSQQPEGRAYSRQPGHGTYSQQQPSPQRDDTTYSHGYNSQFSGNNLTQSRTDNYRESRNSGVSQRSSASNNAGSTWASSSSEEAEKSQSTSQKWNKVFSGKSLEGSAVTETDPLDMSEEAKAARWFRRAAQIKNISELSEIPDEDFPEIMPMRKGVNRFVVSKRKTPLERRLTSPQYRRNLPIVSSEPEKDAS